MVYLLGSQQYYQQTGDGSQGSPGMMGVFAPQQMSFDPFVIQDGQISYYKQLFTTMV